MSSSEQHFRLAEIEVNKSTLDEKIIGIFRYEGESRSKRVPTFLLLVEFQSTSYVYEQLLDVLNATAEQARRLTVQFDADPMARFEKVIQRLNEAIASFVEQSPTPIAWNRVNIFALELSEGHLCFSGTGRLMNAFLQRQENGTFRSFDLFGSLEQPAEPNPKKVFASLVCGDIKPGDILLAGTQNLERLRGELRLIDRLSTLPPVTAALEIQQEIESREIPDDFAGIIIASVLLPKHAEEPLVELSKEKSTESIEHMHEQEKEAEALLSPTIAPVPRGKRSWSPKALLAEIRPSLNKSMTWIKERLKKPKPVPRDPMALASLRGMNAGVGTFMTKRRKMTFLAGGCVIMSALIGTVWYHYAKKASAAQALWNSAYDQAVDRKNRAEADLVYSNEAQARGLVQEALSILTNLDEKTTSRKKAKQDLLTELADVQTKLKHENVIDHPTVLFSLPNDSSGNSRLSSIALYKDTIFTVDPSGQAVIQINPLTKEIKRIGLSTDDSQAVTLTAAKDSVLLETATGTLLSIDPITGKTKLIPFGKTRASTPKAMEYYNNRIYALDPSNNMIWKYSAAAGGFAQEASYLKQTNSNLADSTAIAIDSNVYIGFASGKLTRYLSGVEEVWQPNPADPPIKTVADLWTTPDTDRLALTDPEGKRVIIYRKDGQLISQIRSGDFTGPTALVGDDKAKKLYVVDGSKIFVLDLP
ncbi:MAG TPA: hypothetical protein VFQ60_00855 [Patescibacteria group bacterium]|nr:hypothetical protein [Patescibacteria group bacterium]